MSVAILPGLDYEEVPDESRIAVGYLLKLKDRLGIPDEATIADIPEKGVSVIIKYAFEIYKVWAALYPEEHKEFIAATEFDLKYERGVKEAVKAGGYSPMAYPMRLDGLYHILLPKVKTQAKRFWVPLLKQIPELRRTNYFK